MAAFASDLRRLRHRAGNPTYRDMARSALFSSSVLSSAASGYRLPTLQVTLAFVAACDGDREGWRRRWLQVAGSPEVAGGAVSRPTTRPAPHECTGHTPLPRPAQLPSRPGALIGRVDELHRLHAPPPIPRVIHGPVGVGKTQLALTYAHNIAPGMVDGQLYADFATLPSAGAAVLGFLHALGVPREQLPGAPDQQAGLYRSLLAERRMVVLLDNVRDEQQVRPLLGETPHSVTIVVGRAALLGLRDVRRVRLDVLPRTDAIAMIAAAVPGPAEADLYGCDRIAELCGDLPLALDIAARRLAAQPGALPRVVARRLAEPADALQWLRIGDVSLRASLHSAVSQVGAPAMNLLRRLARLPAHQPGVAALVRDPGCGAPVDDELVEELIEAGLLSADRSGRYRPHPLVRAFMTDHGAAPDPRPLCVDSPAQRPRTGCTTGRPLSLTGAPAPAH